MTGWGRNPFSNFTDGPLPNKVTAYLDLAAEINKHVQIPVIAVGRMLPDVADEAIGAGRIDFAAMGRPEQVRPCINCYVCVQENFWDDTPLCAVNPALGDEGLLPLQPTSTRRHVVVVGPSGLETARLLTLRGHRVTVLDKSDRLGGTLWFSTLTTPDNERLLTWLTAEVERLGIDVRLKTTATPKLIEQLAPGHVVVATGAVRPRPDIDGGDLPHVQTGDTLRNQLLGDAETSGGSFTLRAVGRLGKLSGVTKSRRRFGS